MNPNDNQNGKNGGNDNNRQPIIVLILLSLVALFITSFIYNAAGSRSTQEISYSKFLSLVEEDKVKSVTFTSDKVNITLKDGASISSDDKQTEESFADSYFKATGQSLKVTYYTVYLNDPDLLPLLKEHKVEIKAEGNDNTYAIIMNVLSFVIPLVLLWVIFGVFMRRMGNGAFGVGKSNAKVYVEKSTGVTFADVAGQDEAKESLTEVVDFLHNPQKYKMIGARPVPARPCLPRRSPERPECLSSPWPAPTSSRCSSASVPPVSVTSSRRPRRRLPALFSSMRSMPSESPGIPAMAGATTSGSRP